jgi:hypothetical protein
MKPEAANPEQIPNGAAWAAMLAVAAGCAAMGVLVDLAERFPSVSRALNFYTPTGDLSGKTTLAILVWIAAWIVLHRRWRKRLIQSPGMIAAAVVILVLLGMVAVFPPFFELFAAG